MQLIEHVGQTVWTIEHVLNMLNKKVQKLIHDIETKMTISQNATRLHQE
jgi:hypothetical protein